MWSATMLGFLSRLYFVFSFVSKRSSGLTSESINKLTRPRFGKRAEGQKDVMLPLSKLTRARFGKRDSKDEEIMNIMKRSNELFDLMRPRYG